MSELATVISRFSAFELAIRRLYSRVPEFRTVCEDYVTARAALERWRNDEGKKQEFQELLEEIEAEIEEYIEGSLSSLRRNEL
jgi:hypothetical protein